MPYRLMVAVATFFLLNACLESSDGDDQGSEVSAEFTVYSANKNEFVASVTPESGSEVDNLKPVISITMRKSYPDVTDLQAEVFGFPKGEDCVIEGDGFRCDGEYPIVIDDLEGNLPDNTWHSDGIGLPNQSEADYEIFQTDAGVDVLTVTFTLQDNHELSADKEYVVHVFGGKVQYSDQEGDDTTDFKTYWLFTTAAPSVE